MKHGMRVGAIALAAILGAGALEVHKDKETHRPVVAVEAPAGPQCTPTYPRGFKVAKGTKKRPLSVCKNGDLQSTWGECHTRYRA